MNIFKKSADFLLTPCAIFYTPCNFFNTLCKFVTYGLFYNKEEYISVQSFLHALM